MVNNMENDKNEKNKKDYTYIKAGALLAMLFLFFFMAMHLHGLFTLNEVNSEAEEVKQEDQTHNYQLAEVYYTNERYRILAIEIYKDNVYAILCLDNGQIKYIQLTSVAIQNVTDIKNAYLYRENGQIYIRQE